MADYFMLWYFMLLMFPIHAISLADLMLLNPQVGGS